MRRVWAILGSVLFFLVAPGVVAGLAPWWIARWHMQPPLLGLSLFRTAGAGLIVLGMPALLDSFARFAVQGLGTPAPIFPTRHLVVTGLYRHVRNPMVCRSGIGDRGAGSASGKSTRTGLRGAGLAGFLSFCDRLRGTYPTPHFWRRVRKILRAGSALDSEGAAVARRVNCPGLHLQSRIWGYDSSLQP
jgi:hypothetical protein